VKRFIASLTIVISAAVGLAVSSPAPTVSADHHWCC